MVAVLRRLPTFEGRSRFTTWAYKFAILQAGVAVRAQAWRDQRRVVLALLVEGVPIDVLADRLGSSRNALYKALHDARQRLRHALVASGHLDAPTTRSTS